MLLKILRFAYIGLAVTLAILGYAFFAHDLTDGPMAGLGYGVLAAVAGLAVAGLVLFADLREPEKDITVISTLTLGLLIGLLLGWLLTLPVRDAVDTLTSAEWSDGQKLRLVLLVRAFLSVVCSYLAIATLLQTKDQFRFVIPYVEFSKQTKGGRPLVLDTSVIIDGRIADLCDTRLIDSRLIVPRFVLNELQGIADSSDKLKRNRGRRGLDVLKRLQSNPKLDLLMHDGNAGELRPGERVRVDERLVLFTKAVNGKVVTNDFNLNRVAQLQGVEVINLNEVANSLKTVALPGEYLQVRVVKPGDQPMQGVGYLDDGTMVVIEQGRGQVGNEVSIVVTSVLQTPAGRMIFGRIEARPSGAFAPVGSGPQVPVQGSQGGAGGSAAYQPVKPNPPPGGDKA